MDLNNIHAKKVAVYTDSTVSSILHLIRDIFLTVKYRSPNSILSRQLLNHWISTRSTMLSMIPVVLSLPIPVSSLPSISLVNTTLMLLSLSVVVPLLIPLKPQVSTVPILKLTFWISSMLPLVKVCLSERS